MATQEANTGSTASSDVSPIVAALISLVIPGVGHYLAGMKNRGMAWFAGAAIYWILSLVLVFVGIGILMLFAVPIINIACAADAYIQTEE